MKNNNTKEEETYIITFRLPYSEDICYITDIINEEYDDTWGFDNWGYSKEEYTKMIENGAEVYTSIEEAEEALQTLKFYIERDEKGLDKEEIEEFGEDWTPPFSDVQYEGITQLINVDGEYYEYDYAEIHYPEYISENKNQGE